MIRTTFSIYYLSPYCDYEPTAAIRSKIVQNT
eukprot:UN19358